MMHNVQSMDIPRMTNKLRLLTITNLYFSRGTIVVGSSCISRNLQFPSGFTSKGRLWHQLACGWEDTGLLRRCNGAGK
jgi:hypothetical protein